MARQTSKAKSAGLKYGFHSGLEGVTAEYLRQCGVDFEYEAFPVPYVKPQKVHKYTPDFPLPNGIILETKGRFMTADRQKMVLIKKQHPDLDIRFVFSRSSTKINKGSKTTYAMWCRKNGYQFADGLPPREWLDEPPNPAALAAIEAIRNG